jgi:hypothetical protein
MRTFEQPSFRLKGQSVVPESLSKESNGQIPCEMGKGSQSVREKDRNKVEETEESGPAANVHIYRVCYIRHVNGTKSLQGSTLVLPEGDGSQAVEVECHDGLPLLANRRRCRPVLLDRGTRMLEVLKWVCQPISLPQPLLFQHLVAAAIIVQQMFRGLAEDWEVTTSTTGLLFKESLAFGIRGLQKIRRAAVENPEHALLTEGKEMHFGWQITRARLTPQITKVTFEPVSGSCGDYWQLFIDPSSTLLDWFEQSGEQASAAALAGVFTGEAREETHLVRSPRKPSWTALTLTGTIDSLRGSRTICIQFSRRICCSGLAHQCF